MSLDPTVDPGVDTISLDDVERAIGAPSRLPIFHPLLERQFEADNGSGSCRRMFRHNYIALAVYHCFLISDYKTIGDVFQLDLWLHFGVNTPIVIGLHLILRRNPQAWIREGMQLLAVIVVALTIAVAAMASRMPDRDTILLTLDLIVPFALFTVRIQFLYCVACCLFIQFLHLIASMSFAGFSTDRIVMLNFNMAALVMFSLVGSYNLDREHRAGYLLSLRDRLRHRLLEIASRRDPLTGVGNRLALDMALAGLAVSPRFAAIALLDIDHFKAFNDTNGHQAGDACLVRVAGLVAASAGDEATVYRFGGEEFLVILDAASYGEAWAAGERIRATVAGARLLSDPARDSDAAAIVTISVGIACGSPGAEATAHDLVAAADRALYEAKRAGRNRVCSAPARDTQSPAVRGPASEVRASTLQEGIGAPLVA